MKHEHRLRTSNQQGFTIIELVIATAVFSVVLLIATIAVISVTDSYVKGDIQAETQDAARNIMTTVTQDIQFNTASSVTPTVYDGIQYGFFCAGNDTYFYQLNQEVTASTPHALLEFSTNYCPPAPGSGQNWATAASTQAYVSDLGSATGGDSEAQELLGQNLRLEQLTVTKPLVSGQAYTVAVTVAYGNYGTWTAQPPSSDYTYTCPPETLGGQFCAVSSLTTSITPRIQ